MRWGERAEQMENKKLMRGKEKGRREVRMKKIKEGKEGSLGRRNPGRRRRGEELKQH